jgi:hypothetical protein
MSLELELQNWLNESNQVSRSILLRLSSTNPPDAATISRHAVVVSYGDAVCVVETTQRGLSDLLKVNGVLGAEAPKRRFAVSHQRGN